MWPTWHAPRREPYRIHDPLVVPAALFTQLVDHIDRRRQVHLKVPNDLGRKIIRCDALFRQVMAVRVGQIAAQNTA